MKIKNGKKSKKNWNQIKEFFSPASLRTDPFTKIRPALWIVILIVWLFVVFVIQFGYVYLVKLNDRKNDPGLKNLTREQIILNEVYWTNKLIETFKTSQKTNLDLDITYKNFKVAIDTLQNIDCTMFIGECIFKECIREYVGFLEGNADNIYAIDTSQVVAKYNGKRDSLIKSLEKTQMLFERDVSNARLELKQWNPKIGEVLKSSLLPFIFLIVISALVFISLNSFYGGLLPRPVKFTLIVPYIPIFLVLFTYLVMSASGRIDIVDIDRCIFLKTIKTIDELPILVQIILSILFVVTISHRLFKRKFFHKTHKTDMVLLLIIIGSLCLCLIWIKQCFHIWCLIIVTYWLYFFYYCVFRKSYRRGKPFEENEQKLLDYGTFSLVLPVTFIFLYLILQATGEPLPGVRFVHHNSSQLIRPDIQKLLAIGLEFSIGAMILVATLIYYVFPQCVAGYYKEKSGNRKNAGQFLKLLEFIGWNDKYQYFIKEVFTSNSIQCLFGLVGSITVLFVPFFFSSIGYYASGFLLTYFKAILFLMGLLLLSWYLMNFVVSTLMLMVILFIGILLCSFLFLGIVFYWVIIPLILILCVLFFPKLNRRYFTLGHKNWPVFVITCSILLSILAISLRDTALKYKIPLWFLELQAKTDPPFYEEPIVLLLSFIPLLGLWLTPMITSLVKIQDVFVTRTTNILRKILLELNNHTIVFGYGDLGLKVGRGIVKRFIKPKTESKIKKEIEQYEFGEIYSTRRNEVLRVCKNIVVVDLETTTFDETYPDQIYGTIGVCDIEIPHKDEKNVTETGKTSQIKNLSDIVFLGIKGDCKETGIHDKANLEKSQCVILSARDEKAAVPVFNEIYKLHQQEKNPKAILGAESSLYGAYLEWRSIDKAIYFIFPAQLRGITVGEIISADMINRVQESKSKEATRNNKRKKLHRYMNDMKIMILGRSNVLYYIIHALGEDLNRLLNFERNKVNVFLEKNVFLVSNDKFIQNNHISTPKGDYWPIRATAIGLDPARDLKIRVLLKSPSDATVLKPILKKKKQKPDIIVIATKTSHENLGIAHEVLLSLERINKNRTPTDQLNPHIIIGSRRIEWEQIRDAIACWRTAHFCEESMYPIQQVDSVVDYYDDAGQMILGLYDTFLKEDKNESKPVEITDCAMDVPGILGEITAYLTGLQFMPQNKNTNQNIPNFHNYRSVNNGSANFSKLIKGKEIADQYLGYCFFSGATIEEKDIAKLREEVKSSPRSCVIGATKNNLELMSELLYNHRDSFFKQRGCIKNEKKCKEKCLVEKTCPKRRLCPIDNFRRHLEVADNDTKNNHKMHYFCNPSKDTTMTKKDDNTTPFETYAQIALCGYGAEQCGAMARAINLLLFRDNVEITKKNDKKYPDKILNITYTRSYGCYCPERSYQKIYGRLTENPFKENKNFEELKQNTYFNALLIRPTRKGKDSFDKWFTYAQAIFQTCQQHNNKSDYRLAVGRSAQSQKDDNEIILIYQYNWEYFNKIFKEKIYIDFLDNLYKNKKGDHFKIWNSYKNSLENNCKNQGIPNEIAPDMFLFIVRGIQESKFKLLGHCMVRETTCPFEKIRDEAERYGIIWSDGNSKNIS